MTDTIEDVFARELDTAIQAEEADTGFREQEWMTAGARGCQGRAWWEQNGPQMVRSFTDWYEANPDVSVWITPDGKPAIELEIQVEFGGIPVRMFIDLVLRIGTALVVVDLKSGAKSPENLNQLSIYASGVELAYGIRPKYGTFFMLRGIGKEEPKAYFLTPTELSGYQHSIEWWSGQFRMLDQAVKQEVFIANVGERCKRCGVAYACAAVGGKEAGKFDTSVSRGMGEWRTRLAAV